MESEKPLMPSTSRDIPQPSSRKLRLLEKTRRLVLFSGIAAFGTWAVVGYSTSWTGPAPHRNCHFEADKGKNFKWEDVSRFLSFLSLFLANMSARIGDSNCTPRIPPVLGRLRVRKT